MKILLKITLFLSILGFILIPSAYALSPTLVDLNLVSNTNINSTNRSEENINSSEESNVPKVTTVTNEDKTILTAENIINIILIVVGIVLILLAIAILIRLK